MRTLSWDREEAIVGLRRDVWRYVTQASDTQQLVLNASALLQMAASEVRFLAQLQFILGEPAGRLLDQMPFLIRRLSTTTITELEVSNERIRGPIRWGETFAQRAAMGSGSVFVTAPARRAFDTPENEVLAFALHAIAEFGRKTGWDASSMPGPATIVRDRVAEATRWLQARALMDFQPAPPHARTVSRGRASRHRRRYQAALEVVDLWMRYIARLDRSAIREAVEQHALVASRDSVLLELQCAFLTIKSLRALGWMAPPTGLLRPPVIFRGHRDGSDVTLYYQHVPPRLSSGSRYRAIQQLHHFPSSSGLIPDLVIRTETPGSPSRWLLMEVKGGPKRPVEGNARAALADLLGYRQAFEHVLSHQDGVYGIGYAWGKELEPTSEGEIALCTPDTLMSALTGQFGT